MRFGIDGVVMPVLIFLLAYEPNFAHGYVDYFESGIYLSVINGLYHGQYLYKDIQPLFMFGPLLYLEPYFLMHIFGKTLAVLRGYFLASDIATMLGLYIMCKCLIKNRWTANIAALLIVMQVHHPFWSCRWGGLRFLFSYISLGCLLCSYKFPKVNLSVLYFLGGIFAAMAFWHSFDMGMVLLLPTLVYFLCFFYIDPGPKKSLLYYLAGFFVISSAFIFYFFITGSFPAFFDDLLSISSWGVWSQPVNWKARPFLEITFPAIIYVTSFLYSLRSGLLSRSSQTLPLFVMSIFGFIFYIFAFHAIAGPQFTNVFSIVILVSFMLFDRFDREHPRKLMRYLQGALIVVSVFFFIFCNKEYYTNGGIDYIYYQMHKKGLFAGYYGAYPGPMRRVDPAIAAMKGSLVPSWQAKEIKRIFDTVSSSLKPGQPLFTYPDLSFFNFVCDRPPLDVFSVSGFAYTKNAWRQELMKDLIVLKPKLILTRTYYSPLARSIGRGELMPQIDGYISKNYLLLENTGTVSIYSPLCLIKSVHH